MTDGSIEILLVRMEGKMDLITEKLNRQDSDLATVRQRQHELASSFQNVQGLPEKISVLNERVNAHSVRLDVHDNDRAKREGMATASKWIYAALGGLVSAVIGLIGLTLKYMGG